MRGDLFDKLTKDDRIDIFPTGENYPGRPPYTIPTEKVATDHLEATRKCLFSGVYDGSYRATVSSDPNRELDEGHIYYAVEPFADPAWATGVTFSFSEQTDSSPTPLSGRVDIGVIGSTITIQAPSSPGNELSFVTPRVVTGIWKDGSDGGTSALTLAEGNPRATRRIVGVEKVVGGTLVLGLYALDYFGNEGPESGVFRGRYHDVAKNQDFALLLTIAGDAVWPTDATPTMLTLVGTRDDEGNKIATAVTVRVTRNRNDNVEDNRRGDDNYGSFGGSGIGVRGAISGTWCDISGAVGTAYPVPLPRTPPAPRMIRTSAGEIVVAWNKVLGARSYNLYRARGLDPIYRLVDAEPYEELVDTPYPYNLGYRDRLESGVEFSYRLEACNSSGCSPLSPAVSTAAN